MSSTITKTITTKPRKNKQIVKVVNVQSTKTKKKKNRKKKSKSSFGLSDKLCYARTLEDPFSNPPCKMGFGTMVPTNLATLYFRGNIPANADGSLAMFLSPACGTADTTVTAPFHISNSGISTAAWSHAQWFNAAGLLNQCTNARVVACALKVLPIVAATATPPIVYAGAIAGTYTNQLITNTPSALLNYPQLEKMVLQGSELIVRSRPSDFDAYSFRVQPMQNSANSINDDSIPIVVITGLPASATVSVDAIIHLEYLPYSNNVNVTGFVGNTDAKDEGLSNWFSSLEEVWRFTEKHLSNPAIQRAASTAYNIYKGSSANMKDEL